MAFSRTSKAPLHPRSIRPPLHAESRPPRRASYPAGSRRSHPAALPDNDSARQLAILAEVLFLINLMLLPFLAFLLLCILYMRKRHHPSQLVRNHLNQTVRLSLFGGVLLAFILAIIALGGVASGYTWVWVVLYFTFVHTSLIYLGALGLGRALAGQSIRYPFIGRWMGD